MTEFRRDPLTHRWVVTGLVESSNPQDLIPNLKKQTQEECPFCEGHEILTPPEIYAIRNHGHPNEPGWQVRVVPNRATDLHSVELHKRAQGGIYDLQNASGIHEAIIETPKHITNFFELDITQIVRVLKTFQIRYSEHKKNHLLKSILFFRNQGHGGPGTFDHTHSQIISVPFILKTIQDEIEGANRFYTMKTRCIFCDMMVEEKKLNKRIILERNDYMAWCPFAARFPFEIWVASKAHDSEFLNANPNTFEDLAFILKTVLTQLNQAVKDTPVSFILHTAPLRMNHGEDPNIVAHAYHWHIEILPHALPAGGFEWGGDFFLSPPTPENCATILKSGL